MMLIPTLSRAAYKLCCCGPQTVGAERSTGETGEKEKSGRLLGLLGEETWALSGVKGGEGQPCCSNHGRIQTLF